MSQVSQSVTDVRRVIQARSALWAHQQFQFAHPELTSFLHGDGLQYEIHVVGPVTEWEDLCRQFDSEIRPAVSNVKLVAKPTSSDRIVSTTSPSDEFWMVNEPMPQHWVNDLLSLASPNLPAGHLTFEFDPEGYVFQHCGLSKDDIAQVDAAFRLFKLPGTLRFVKLSVTASEEGAVGAVVVAPQFLDLPVAHRLRHVSPATLRLVEEDEESWRQFIAARDGENRLAIPAAQDGFSVLFGADDASEVRLAELLCIYDVVNVVPTYGLEWLSRHGLNLESFQELVALGRLRLVLPAPVTRYPASLIDAAAVADDSSMILSRRLATMVVAHGQHKDPLLYGPYSNQQRIAILRAIQSLGSSSPMAPLVATYSKVFEHQHRTLFRYGASAAFGSGIGALVGEMVYASRGIDARVELSTVGAMVEWAASLGATYLPRDFGGYEESRNATIMANYFNRTSRATTGHVAERMHCVVDGLLTTRCLSPLDVARGVTAQSFWHFRQVARGMITADVDLDRLRLLVADMNEDIRSFEKRSAFLSKYHITSTAGSLAAEPVNNALDLAFPGASIIGVWLARVIATMLGDKGMLPDSDGAFGDVADAFRGLTTMTSMDAVVVARARSKLRK